MAKTLKSAWTAIEVVDFCKKSGIDLVVVGPEAPLVCGIVDDLTRAGVMAFGPSKEAAQLEGSKAFMKVGGSLQSYPVAFLYRRFVCDPDAL